MEAEDLWTEAEKQSRDQDALFAESIYEEAEAERTELIRQTDLADDELGISPLQDYSPDAPSPTATAANIEVKGEIHEAPAPQTGRISALRKGPYTRSVSAMESKHKSQRNPTVLWHLVTGRNPRRDIAVMRKDQAAIREAETSADEHAEDDQMQDEPAEAPARPSKAPGAHRASGLYARSMPSLSLPPAHVVRPSSRTPTMPRVAPALPPPPDLMAQRRLGRNPPGRNTAPRCRTARFTWQGGIEFQFCKRWNDMRGCAEPCIRGMHHGCDGLVKHPDGSSTVCALLDHTRLQHEADESWGGPLDWTE